MTGPSLLSIPAAAARLGVSRMTVYRLISAGELRAVDVGIGRAKTRIRDDDITAYIDRRTAEPVRPAVAAGGAR